VTDPGELMSSLERQLKPYRGECASFALRASVDEVRASPEVRTGLAPMYGMAATLTEDVVRDLLGGYLDLMFEV
jgi:hypothetical protein